MGGDLSKNKDTKDNIKIDFTTPLSMDPKECQPWKYDSESGQWITVDKDKELASFKKKKYCI